MLILRETRYLFVYQWRRTIERNKGGEKPRRKKQGSEMEEVEHLEKDHDVNFLCYTRGIIIHSYTRRNVCFVYLLGINKLFKKYLI